MFSFDSYNMLSSLLISMGINGFFFVFAYTLTTDIFTDFTYSLTFILLTLALNLFSNGSSLPSLVVSALVIIWAVRLGSYLLKRILAMGKDERFDDKRGNFVKFLAFWILQALTVWIIMIPVSIMLSSPSTKSFQPAFWAGLLLWVGGFLMEVVSDRQKFVFKSKQENRSRWIERGLWKYSRHPNYFGEVLLWFAIFLMVLSQQGISFWWTAVSPLFILFLLLFVSGIPLLEKSAERKYGDNPDYRDYKERTNLFFPWFPKRG